MSGGVECTVFDSTPTMSSIGPSIPAHLLASKTTEKQADPYPLPDDDDDDDDSWAPSLPPDLVKSRTVGPSLPTAQEREEADEAEDDDGYGPMPLPAGYVLDDSWDGVKEFMEREERRRKDLEVGTLAILDSDFLFPCLILKLY